MLIGEKHSREKKRGGGVVFSLTAEMLHVFSTLGLQQKLKHLGLKSLCQVLLAPSFFFSQYSLIFSF